MMKQVVYSKKLNKNQTRTSLPVKGKLDIYLINHSFMEKISTGASTDSDLRVITIDSKGEIIKPKLNTNLEAD